ncbi:MAG TPA: hypothetical protein PKY24_12740 [Opitutaceae bacterium]|nr:hypothetical protein [Opitutaceae bacterium]
MTPADFVACAAKEKEELLAAYFGTGSDAEVAKKIEAMRLTPDQKRKGRRGQVLGFNIKP